MDNRKSAAGIAQTKRRTDTGAILMGTVAAIRLFRPAVIVHRMIIKATGRCRDKQNIHTYYGCPKFHSDAVTIKRRKVNKNFVQPSCK
jgi:hypothetical protein